MNLGIVVTRGANVAAATGLLQAALDKGWSLRCFLTDSGVKCLDDEAFASVCAGHSFWMALCEMSVERYHLNLADIEQRYPDLIVGGQYQDAELVKNSDRVLVL